MKVWQGQRTSLSLYMYSDFWNITHCHQCECVQFIPGSGGSAIKETKWCKETHTKDSRKEVHVCQYYAIFD